MTDDKKIFGLLSKGEMTSDDTDGWFCDKPWGLLEKVFETEDDAKKYLVELEGFQEKDGYYVKSTFDWNVYRTTIQIKPIPMLTFNQAKENKLRIERLQKEQKRIQNEINAIRT